jgi:hypothetical protein
MTLVLAVLLFGIVVPLALAALLCFFIRQSDRRTPRFVGRPVDTLPGSPDRLISDRRLRFPEDGNQDNHSPYHNNGKQERIHNSKLPVSGDAVNASSSWNRFVQLG